MRLLGASAAAAARVVVVRHFSFAAPRLDDDETIVKTSRSRAVIVLGGLYREFSIAPETSGHLIKETRRLCWLVGRWGFRVPCKFVYRIMNALPIYLADENSSSVTWVILSR